MQPSLADEILIRGASEHNLKGVNLVLPKRKLIVFTGVSGSGKSSLAFDTLYAEGQRRYVESLSAYARQFLGQMDKPRYDTIRGLSPTISIEQRAASANPRSTVGTVTEVYDYLRLLYARAGTMHCHACGRTVERTDPVHIVKNLETLPERTKLLLMAPIARQKKGTFQADFTALRAEGFVRARIDGEIRLLEEVNELEKHKRHDIDIVVDRLIIRAGGTPRLTDSVETALRVGHGRMVVQTLGDPPEERLYSEARYCAYCDLSLPDPEPALFSFNSPSGACPECNGLGTTHEVALDRLVPDPSLSLEAGAVKPWAQAVNPQQIRWQKAIIAALAARYGFDVATPWSMLTAAQRTVILHGTDGKQLDVIFEGRRGSATVPMPFEGVVGSLRRRFKEAASNRRVEHFKQYLRETACPSCDGERLRPTARAVRLGKLRLPELGSMPIGQLYRHFQEVTLTGNAAIIADEVLREVQARLGFLVDVGLTYLTLNRGAATLSGGEAQRIRLASQVGSELTGVLYILDEPSIGLHPRDNRRLLDTLKRLRDIGNTVIVVEHDAETMLESDYLVDFGPGAGAHGGTVVSHGTPAQVIQDPRSLTGAYLSGRRSIALPETRRQPSGAVVRVEGARANNLQNVDVTFPLGLFTVVTGVSGAGKSSLVNGILHPTLANTLNGASHAEGEHDRVLGLEQVKRVVSIDQKPIGRTPRSNPATYTKVFDLIREVFASTQESRVYGYKAGRFSFNVKGGRCEACQGAGVIKIEMHFLPDVYVTCETCHGRRFNEATLRVRYKGFNIFDVLEMSVDTACEVFANHRRISRITNTLRDVGLGYISLGQPATTLSGGEAQRIKLARELAKLGKDIIYLLDEPSTGLHFEDVRRLLDVINRLVDAGNSVIMIEHNLDIIKTADHVIDVGPEGGDGGGRIVAEGPPEAIVQVSTSYTGQHLRALL